ncbi:MAG: 1-phosphofructokinase family hexose kinase [Nocardioidaceae bacterium]
MSTASAAPTGRVLCVTVNLALDVTYLADSLTAGEANRVAEVHARAGGKGVNVARLLHDFGHPVVVTGLAGGSVGDEIATSLDAGSLAHDLAPCLSASRRTVTAVDRRDGSSTGYYEPGPLISAGEWDRFATVYERWLPDVALVVLAGSLPPGAPADGYRQLIALARDHGVPAVLDVPGEALLSGLAAGPWLVKPNELELAEATRIARPVSVDAAVHAAGRLIDGGAERVVVSLGARGLVGVCARQVVVAVPPTVMGNPVGAGDAVVATLTHAHLTGVAWPQALRLAAATAAAAVRMHVAGAVDHHDVDELYDRVEVCVR